MNTIPVAFVLTLAIELPLAWLLRPPIGAIGRREWLATCACANALSHPLACVALASAGFVTIEIGVVALETFAYRHVAGASWLRSLSIACVANVCSACFSFD